ncbi:hypothetical protein [Candidatus Stoquefichus massiliensis]|uniref:hypothetical protein n=1 Tax=Candidatus Stoquefichus massiliensis TaxID=1470350 RepID=UPI000489A2D0|nr:hypothetical protein [Candidatus Stoquefichus massiliensis]
MTIVMKENVQFIVKDEKVQEYIDKGFKQVKKVDESENNEKKQKSLSKMNSGELKELAAQLGIEIDDSLTNKEIVAIIKEAQNGNE